MCLLLCLLNGMLLTINVLLNFSNVHFISMQKEWLILWLTVEYENRATNLFQTQPSCVEPNKHTHATVSKVFQLPDFLLLPCTLTHSLAHTHIGQRPCAFHYLLCSSKQNVSHNALFSLLNVVECQTQPPVSQTKTLQINMTKTFVCVYLCKATTDLFW